MTFSNWFFGTWGIFNLVALGIVFFLAPRFAESADAAVVFLISVVIPFVQTVLLSLKWHLNFSKYKSSDYRRLIYRRWWQVFRRTPVASTAMIACIVAAGISQVMHGPGRLGVVNGQLTVSRSLFVFLFAFSSITVHTNLVVGRKCQDILHSPLESKAEIKKKRSKRKRGTEA